MSHFTSDEEAHQVFEEEMKSLVENYIGHFGGYGDDVKKTLFVHDGHYKRLKKMLEDIIDNTVKRFEAKKERSEIWPFRDKTLKVNKNFETLYKELARHAFDRQDRDANESIALHDGKSFRSEKYDDVNKHGNVVIEPDFEKIEFNTGIGKRTAQALLRKMVKAGVLFPLNRKGNQSRWYIYGDWQKTRDSYKVNTRINRAALQDKIKEGLLEQGLVKPVK